MTKRFLLLAPLALAACQSPPAETAAGSTATDDQADIATAAARDYMIRYSQDVCVDPVTTGRSGPEEIPHDVANRTITWTSLIRDPRGMYQPLNRDAAATIEKAWDGVHAGNYPGVTLPADALPQRKEPCAKTLKLMTPIVAGDMGFVRWSDGTTRRTMALRKGGHGWSVIAEGPAKIG
jgi:hypothetical protein